MSQQIMEKAIVIYLGLHEKEHEKGLHPVSMKARLVEKPLDH